jgi:hypothetical protein
MLVESKDTIDKPTSSNNLVLILSRWNRFTPRPPEVAGEAAVQRGQS